MSKKTLKFISKSKGTNANEIKPAKVVLPLVLAVNRLLTLQWPTKVSNFVNVHKVMIRGSAFLSHAMVPIRKNTRINFISH